MQIGETILTLPRQLSQKKEKKWSNFTFNRTNVYLYISKSLSIFYYHVRLYDTHATTLLHVTD